MVRVYTDDNYLDELFAPVSASGGALYAEAKHSSDWKLEEDSGAGLKELSVGRAVLPLIVEISYPADMPYDERTKAYFRFEIFNEQYKLKQED